MSYTREQLDSIKRQAGLKPYQKRLPDLEPDGAGYLALCPWHEKDGNHSPSLAVFQTSDGDAWAFACRSRCEKKKGDVFAFVRFVDNCTFGEAVRRVAEHAGLMEEHTVPKSIEKPTQEQYDQVRQYLIARGIPLDFAKNYTKVDAVVHPKLGLAIAFPYDADPEVIKYRAVYPKSKNEKFSHASGHPSESLLYNISHAAQEISKEFIGAEVFVVESERDCLTMEACGFTAVSVSSAVTCLDRDGLLKISDDQLKVLAKADYVFIATDQDSAGEKCAAAFEQSDAFNAIQVKRISWPFGGKRTKDPKDIGDLYLQNPAEFHDRILTLADDARMRPPKWRQQFKTVGEMDAADILQPIEGFLTEGNVGFGGLSGHGKSFVALSITKALTTGHPFVGRFTVPEIRPVLYLCPEVGERQLNRRIRFFGIPDDDGLFLCRTLSQGETLPLDHPHVLEAIRQLGKPIVILDTAIRFSNAEDENSASGNVWMERATRGLREAGALAVVLLHHSPKKASKEKKFIPTLENTFRGTGDIGALLDIGYNIRIDDSKPGTEITITNVKPRDFDPPRPFNLGLKMSAINPKTGRERSFIEETHDLVLMAPTDTADHHETSKITKKPKADNLEADFEEFVQKNPETTYQDAAEVLGKNKGSIFRLAVKLGWAQADGRWVKQAKQTTVPDMEEVPF